MKRVSALVLTTGLLLLTAVEAQAYIGPGAGLSAVGAVIAVAAAMILAVVGFVWYPVKRLMRRRSAAKSGAAQKAPRRANADR